jgi:hypothetical protein
VFCGLYDRAEPTEVNVILSNDNKQILKSWVKVFGAAVVALYLAGVRDPWLLLDAGAAALLPIIYSWLDPSDARFGKKPVVKKAVRKVAKK